MEAAGVKAQQTEAAVGRKKWDQLAGELESVPVRLRGQKITSETTRRTQRMIRHIMNLETLFQMKIFFLAAEPHLFVFDI